MIFLLLVFADNVVVATLPLAFARPAQRDCKPLLPGGLLTCWWSSRSAWSYRKDFIEVWLVGLQDTRVIHLHLCTGSWAKLGSIVN